MRVLILALTVLAGPAAALCPDPSLDAPAFVATGAELIAPQSWDVQAGVGDGMVCGTWVLAGVDAGGTDAFLPAAPSATFGLTGLGPHILMVMAQADCAPVLAARTHDGVWYFGETANGREEIVLWGASDGVLQVWVGAQASDGCDAELTLETFDR